MGCGSSTLKVAQAPVEGAGAVPQAQPQVPPATVPTDAEIAALRKLTPAQEKAAKAAAERQDKVAARAAEVPTGSRPAANNFYADAAKGDGKTVDKLLEHTPLIDLGYVIDLIQSGGVAPRLQEVPKSALITLDNAWRIRCWKNSCLPVVVLSYPWLDWYHPDREGAQLKRLIPIFEAVMKEVGAHRLKRFARPLAPSHALSRPPAPSHALSRRRIPSLARRRASRFTRRSG